MDRLVCTTASLPTRISLKPRLAQAILACSRWYHTDRYVYGNRELAKGTDGECALGEAGFTNAPHVRQLLQWYRKNGHLITRKINPLQTPGAPAMQPFALVNGDGLTSELNRLPNDVVNQTFGVDKIDRSGVLDFLETVYCGDMTVEFDHVLTTVEYEYFAKAFETIQLSPTPLDIKLQIAKLLLNGQALDKFLAAKFASVKRYSGEGAETLLVAVDTILRRAVEKGVKSSVIAMPHRGRNNLLTVLLNYPPSLFFKKMFGQSEFASGTLATGDTFSHFFTSTKLSYKSAEFGDKQIQVSLVPNPSHLEANLPIAVGKARAKMRNLEDGDYSVHDSTARNGDKVLCIQIHGDGSVTGQGVVSETLCLSGVPNYDVGGSIHIVVNNQVAYTTEADRGSGLRYPTDVGKCLGCPVIHVNGDRPEAVHRALTLALDYRQQFRRDVFVELLCYRQWGHNELDDPTITQPKMYEVIHRHQAVADAYLQQLKKDPGVPNSELEEMLQTVQKWQERLDHDFRAAKELEPVNETFQGQWKGYDPVNASASAGLHIYNTGLDLEILRRIGLASIKLPNENFNTHQNIRRTVMTRRKNIFDGATRASESKVDWATGEALAIGSLLRQGCPVRVSGQDVGRGTFSQRHAMLVDQETDAMCIPFNLVPDSEGWAKYEVANSPLSEAAVCGFELGFAADHPQQLTIWELQFGDFFNGAQVQIDTYLGASETKWYTQNGLVIFLPHGYDGAGPEHSSCRIERWLQLTDSLEAPAPPDCQRPDGKPSSADTDVVNLHVVFPTTPAQLFHVLRRQVMRPFRRPLVVIGPKILLRLAAAVSSLEEFGPRTYFRHVIGPEMSANTEKATSVVFCSGKHYYELSAYLKANMPPEKAGKFALIRIEQLTPFPVQEIADELKRFPNVKRFIWSQEEHRNMGAWSFVSTRLRNFLGIDLRYAGRCEMACPAVGTSQLHKSELAELLKSTFQ